MKDVLPVQWREFYCYVTLLAGIFFEKRSHCVQEDFMNLACMYIHTVILVETLSYVKFYSDTDDSS